MARSMAAHPRSRAGLLPAVVGDEGAEGEESCPEAAFSVSVVEGRGEGGEPEPRVPFVQTNHEPSGASKNTIFASG